MPEHFAQSALERAIGHKIWDIYTSLLRMLDQIFMGADFHRQPNISRMKSVSFLIEPNPVDPTNGISLIPVLEQTVRLWREGPGLFTRRDDFYLDIQLPQPESEPFITTDIVIPILLPDDLDPEDSAQFFREHFDVCIEADTPDQTTAICLVNPRGEMLFHTQPEMIGKQIFTEPQRQLMPQK